MKFDLIVPCYNPTVGWDRKFVTSVKNLHREIQLNFCCTFQILLVNDGSIRNFTDTERVYILSSGIPVEIITNQRNCGKGYSIRKACKLSAADYCVYTDLDFPFGTSSIVDMLKILERGYDITMGARSRTQYLENASFARRNISNLLLWLNTSVLNMPFEDTQAGIKGFNQAGKKIFLSTTINGFLFDLEFLKKASTMPEIRIKDIPVANDSSLHLSSFGVKTLTIEAFNFIKILTRNKYESGSKKDITWNRLGGI